MFRSNYQSKSSDKVWGGPVSKTLLGSDNYFLRDQIERNWVVNTSLAEIIGSPVIHDNKIFVFGANGQVKCINLLDRTTSLEYLNPPN